MKQAKKLNIHGYFITYPRLFHYVSTDILLRIHGYFIKYPRLRRFFRSERRLFLTAHFTFCSAAQGFLAIGSLKIEPLPGI